ncbi:Lysyl oxidase-like 2 [Exaiptasia diaphana]|nr:Lysyl oxidase-like 2 [Exaiptasia diaphana]
MTLYCLAHQVSKKRCFNDLHGESGKLSINKSNCLWTIGKGKNNINFIVIKFQPFDLGYRCYYYQATYFEIADEKYEFRVRECGGMRPFEVLIKDRPAVIRYHSDNGYWHRFSGVNVTFYIITQKLSGFNAESWKPVLKESKPGEVTVNWDPLTLPSKNYIVVPLYNSTAKGEPFLHIIEHKNNTSIAVEYLKPATSYWFKVIAFDPTNTTGSFIEATTLSLAMKNETLRLMGGQFSNEGRVEVFKNGSWNKICGYPWWNTNTANVVCRSLGLPSPTHNTPRGLLLASATPVDTTLVLSYLCNGTETNLKECSWIIASSICQRANLSSQAEVVCGHPSVFHQNITEMTGVITSPGYPSFMMQADYRWTFMQSLTRTHVVLKFDELDLRRSWNNGYSSVSIQESGRVYRNRLYHGVATVFTLPGQLKFYSSVSTRRYINSQSGRGMLVRFFSCREQESTLNNWTISFSSHHYNSISAHWTQSNVTGYDILGFLMSCNSKQEWANETFYHFGESNSTTLTCNGLIWYTQYDVYVLMMVRTGDTCTAYKSNTSITTQESCKFLFLSN